MKTLDEVKQEYLQEALKRPLSRYSLKNANGKIVVESNSQGQHAFTDEQDEDYARQHYKVSENFKTSEGKVITFWKMELSPSGLFRSADGNYYTENELPENDDDFIKSKYSDVIKVERNARICDTDDYIKLPDITVQKMAKAKRTALSDEDRAYLEAYRQALRNMPETAGFPFVDWPEFPSALAYELQQKVESRDRMKQGGF
ncbi:cell wall protein [Burkholderiales bacterium YL45]|uniref:Cell wall protein n=1 Tax=Turicimonas muris TaxID=1796652 RepID=A0A227KSM8_9BURK|nr:phage tail assembly chaperone [Turicimonas muris]ANU65045.1 cell wall protein [Burkholderiales bacterium YL45]OXE50847.1 cell wall protein [Turicimonas muris]QQQ96207.1 phage tail assembly chaperone [Turicimonas muris]